ncbi:MAG TPA: glycine betaine ABC transporter substrate-binding protein, partial [Steroidobacteraceae bacterium]
MARLRKALLLSSLLLTATLACAAAPVVVSSKLSSESAMIGQMIRLLLEAHGIPTVDRMAIGATPVVRKALLAGEIDLYVEYTGNAGFFFNRADEPVWKDLQRGYKLGARLDYDANRIVWLTPAAASNSWALAVRRDIAKKHRL